MSDCILQGVIADLRPNILEKLRTESEFVRANTPTTRNKITVDTHRGDAYQFCYFLRKTGPHSLVVKTRNYSAALPVKPQQFEQGHSKRKRQPEKDTRQPTKKFRRHGKGKGKRVVSDDGSSSSDDSTAEDGGVTYGSDEEASPMDTSINTEKVGDNSSVLTQIMIEQEEEKPKPILQLKYRGFHIYGCCLCVVVEPWPPIRSTPRAPSIAPKVPASVIAPPDFVPPRRNESASREHTPLFLPDDDDLPPPGALLQGLTDQGQSTQLFRLNQDEPDDHGDMMELSQLLTQMGDFPGVVMDDENEIDGAVFFSDADEVRELDRY
ncbi:hypothetical protein AX16_001069 [Volvariella volvacea WC 439]|nr:hypothetical protein AX16_001069 [Volvariella volvacea WC 439]